MVSVHNKDLIFPRLCSLNFVSTLRINITYSDIYLWKVHQKKEKIFFCIFLHYQVAFLNYMVIS